MIDLFKKLIEWAKRDNVCAAAVILGLIGAVPNILASLSLFINSAVIPLVQAATGAK